MLRTVEAVTAREAAWHEAGHAVVATALGFTLSDCRISRRSDGFTGQTALANNYQRHALRWLTVIFAGWAGQADIAPPRVEGSMNAARLEELRTNLLRAGWPEDQLDAAEQAAALQAPNIIERERAAVAAAAAYLLDHQNVFSTALGQHLPALDGEIRSAWSATAPDVIEPAPAGDDRYPDARPPEEDQEAVGSGHEDGHPEPPTGDA